MGRSCLSDQNDAATFTGAPPDRNAFWQLEKAQIRAAFGRFMR